MIRSSVPVICCALLAAVSGDTQPGIITKTFKTEDGLYGVASIAGVASRNGRVSSMSGVKFYPSNDMDGTFLIKSKDKDGSYVISKSGNKRPEPISFSKEENGKFTSGTIDIRPGSVSVSSIARSAIPKGEKFDSKFNIMDDDMFFPSLPAFHSRSMNPWFSNVNFMQPLRFNSFRGWPYPGYTPFYNLWR